ncbi:MAG: beta-lactamase/D-alanine carboxypeptidase [Bacteroidetes bacterium ADurb.Bin408]|nr:MAG: beta-lactamase/D-alanine carboxypeptidase [Bacteroidetes bacterium ADurb.Bin408]
MDSVDFCAKVTFYISKKPHLFFQRSSKRLVRTTLIVTLSAFILLSCNTSERLLRKNPSSCISGYVAPGFEEVKDIFAVNFAERGEKGAALSVYLNDTIVVNLYGGYRDKKFKQKWDENTLVLLFSASKGIAAMTTVIGISQELFKLDDKVGTYWQGFSNKGKETITINHLLTHQSGIPMFDKNIRIKHINDTVYIRHILENQKTYWEPGTQQAYQLYSGGLYLNELFKHTDTLQRSLAQYFYDEITAPGIIMPDHNKARLLGIPMFYRFGFRKPSPNFSFGTSEKAFGMTGAGGSFAFADPELKLGYCYGTRKMKGFAHTTRVKKHCGNVCISA